jgi:dipeptidyl aminopeptidase/acylaminoacyl peptidase
MRRLDGAANLKPAEEIEWTGALGKKIHGSSSSPANFDPTRSIRSRSLIHGGPQSAWNDNWGYRWNPQVFANAGYVALLRTRAAQPAMGNSFVNEISGDWGGKVYVDLMNGVADVLRRNSFIDRNRVGAAGASYGGYMVNWILGHNNDPRFRSKCSSRTTAFTTSKACTARLKSFGFRSGNSKERHGPTRRMYARWSPHKFVQNFNTPILIIHSELDYRVPIGEGMQLFTAVQRMGIDSKMLIFPDEGHWV